MNKPMTGFERLLAKMSPKPQTGFERLLSKLSPVTVLSDSLLQHILSYLTPLSLANAALVCKRWAKVACRTHCRHVDLVKEPEINLPAFLARKYLTDTGHYKTYGEQDNDLRSLSIPVTAITGPVLTDLTAKCPGLRDITIDFSTAVQSPHVSTVSAFPARLHRLTLVLSPIIYIDAFFDLIARYLKSVRILHVIGSAESEQRPTQQLPEVLHFPSVFLAAPQLTVFNAFGVVYLTDSHLSPLAHLSNLRALNVTLCSGLTGEFLGRLPASLQTLLVAYCNKITSLPSLPGLRELDLTGTDVDSASLVHLVSTTHLQWLRVTYVEGFNDAVLLSLLRSRTSHSLQSLELSHTSVTEAGMTRLVAVLGRQLKGLVAANLQGMNEFFWTSRLSQMQNLRVFAVGSSVTCCCKEQSAVLADSLLQSVATHCLDMERLEIQWDCTCIRVTDNLPRTLNTLRCNCPRLRSLTLCDGPVYEQALSHFTRVGRLYTVRTTTCYNTTTLPLLSCFQELRFQ